MNENFDRRLLLAGAGLAGVAALSKLAQAGPLNPPAGPVSPTGKTTEEIFGRVASAESLLAARIARTDVGMAEPRIPVQSLPGSATAQHVISQPGSYYLTGNIQGVAGKNGIEIAAGGVTVDLCGSEVAGVNSDAAGVRVRTGIKGVHLFGGVISRWNQAVAAAEAESVVIEDTLAISNGYAGQPSRPILEPGRFGRVSRCKLHGSYWNGISPGRSTIVEECSVTNGANWGIVTGEEEVVVRRCIVRGHVGVGIKLFQSGLVEDCRVDYCQGGVLLEQRAQALRNICTYNSGHGIHALFSDCILDGNLVQRNNFGLEVANSGNLVVRNIARENSLDDFQIAQGNSYGPIVNVRGVGDISSTPGANHPWANFIY